MTNFIRKHSLLAMLFVLAMMLNLTSCLSTADLTKSQRVGAKHSPAAIYAVSVHGNAGVYAVDAVKKYMNEALTNDAGFTLLDQETIDVVCDEAKKKSIEKAKKRAGFKNVMGVLSGRKSIAGAIHDGMSLDDVGYKRKDVFKAVSKPIVYPGEFISLSIVPATPIHLIPRLPNSLAPLNVPSPPITTTPSIPKSVRFLTAFF